MKKNVVDSSGWLEYFADTKNAPFFARAIENVKNLIVPSISIYEVFKHVMRLRSEQEAFECIECMIQGTVVDLTMEISLNAAKFSLIHRLPMADSIIYATAMSYDATVYTQDSDFKGLANVEYIGKE